ncbi:uncharacterized protein [Nicotiana tomentosiformis]|uniref:uncharacterized protein n=1 Tax=Nicotiana tomentosiformis TaxID=4098 RepID=UPI00388C444D
MPRDSLDSPVFVSSLVEDSIVVDQVYRSCVVTINSFDTIVDLLLLDMVDFEVILGMLDMVDFEVVLGLDWFSLHHAILDFYAKIVTFVVLGLPRLEWRRTLGHSTRRVILFLKAQRILEIGCLAYLAYIRHSTVEVPSMDSVPVVRESLKVFPRRFTSMPPDRDIDFCIDLILGTQPISIPPYRMALVELNELKEQLQDLLEKRSLD